MPPLPPIIQALLLSNVALFCLDFVLGHALTQWLALWPVQSPQFMPWQLVTYAFMHGSTEHLFFNMLGLWMFGRELEQLWGPQRFVRFYGASVLAAAATQLAVSALFGWQAPTVGASGGLFGLLLAYALCFPRREFDLIGFLPMLLVLTPSETLNVLGMVLYFMLMINRQAVPIPPVLISATVFVAIYGGIELILGIFFRTGVAHFAHLGGMLGGWLMIRYWRGQPPFTGGPRRR
jgi:membrane associated rhomboid family serine protease